MYRPPIPPDDAQRLEALRGYQVLDTPPEAAFDALVKLAARVANTPIALVSLVDEARQWFKARHGLDACETPRDVSFCGHAILGEAALLVEDAHEDERFADNPLVTGEPHVRFYCGTPLRSPDGFALGTLCVIDHAPRQLDDDQQKMLALLADQVVDQLELRRRSAALERYRVFFETSLNLMCTVDDAFNFREINPAWERVLGWSRAELLSRPFTELVHPDDLAATVAQAELLLGDNAAALVDYRNRFRHKDGRWVPLSWVAAARDGTFYASAMNMTAYERKERELAAAHARMRAVFESAVDAIITIDDRGRVEQANPAVERVFGCSPEELVGQNVNTLMPSPHRERHDNYIARYLRTGEAKIVGSRREVRARRLDGSLFDAELAVTTFQANGRPGFAGVLRDITERKQALHTARHLAAVVESSDDAILTKSLDGTITSWNYAAAMMFGYSEQEAVGAPIEMLFPADRLAEESDILATLRAGERVDHFETVRLRKDGRPVDVSVSISPLYGERGELVGASKIARDIGERKRFERLQAEFVSTVSHELRTPLTSIRGSLGLIAGGVAGALAPKAKELVDIALTNSERLVRLINDILDIEKVESGGMELALRATTLRGALEGAVAANRAYAAEHDVELALVGGVPAGDVLVDPDRFAQVFANLLSNAAKFSPSGSAIELSVTRSGRSCRVSVRDHGPGIPDDFRDRVFERFAQADGSSTRRQGGTGLGLSISKALVERMGGRIGFEPAEGGGTVFFVELPYYAPVAPASSLQGEPRLLICRRDADAARQLALLLSSAGFATDIAPSVAPACELIGSRRYHAIVLDLILADGDGPRLVAELRASATNERTPIIVVSGSADPLAQVAFAVADVLEKPVEERRLLEAIKRAVSSRATGLSARILHVEDNADLQHVLASSLPQWCKVTGAGDVASAKRELEASAFDLVLLDLALPDGRGEELLGLVGNAKVVIFSAAEASTTLSQRVSGALVKSRASLKDVREVVVSLVGGAAAEERS